MFTCTDIDAQNYILLRDGAPDIIYGPHLRYDFENRDDDGMISEGKTRRAVVHAKRVPSNLSHVPAYFKLPHESAHPAAALNFIPTSASLLRSQQPHLP